MKIKKSELYFYELLRDYLYKYLAVQRKFSAATVKNYTDSLDQYRQYLREKKSISIADYARSLPQYDPSKLQQDI